MNTETTTTSTADSVSNSSVDTKWCKGHCCCKAHSFAIEVRFVRFGFASCHCSVCRQSHASPFVLWAGMNASESSPQHFQITSEQGVTLSSFRSSATCQRYFCTRCGSHVYIKYDDDAPDRWAGEIHFPTALLDPESVQHLEDVVVKENGKPRHLHVFYSDRHAALGQLSDWVNAPKYGGLTGLEVLPVEH